MKTIIRLATIEDLKSIQELNYKLFEEECDEFDSELDMSWTLWPEWKKYYTNNINNKNNCAFVAEINEQVVGYLVGSITEEKCPYRILPNMAELDDMFVLAEYRSMWIGSQLHEKFIEWCKSKDVKKLQVSAYTWNIKAINFYKKLGFWDFAVILEKDL